MAHRLPAKPAAAVEPAPRGFITCEVARIECMLCGTRAYSSKPVGCDYRPVSASFAARGWRILRNGPTMLQVCRACARKLGPSWTAEGEAK